MIVKNSPTQLKIDPYLAARMDERRTHVVILVMSHDLWKRKHMTPEKAVAAADLRTILQAASSSR